MGLRSEEQATVVVTLRVLPDTLIEIRSARRLRVGVVYPDISLAMICPPRAVST